MESGFGLITMLIYLLSPDHLLWLEKDNFKIIFKVKTNQKKINWRLFSKEDKAQSTPQ